MATDVKWDISRISSLTRSLDMERGVIENNKDFLIAINSEVEKAWQGYAGRAFDERMDIDAENLRTVIEGIEELVNDLKAVTNDCYDPCEENIENLIRKLDSKI